MTGKESPSFQRPTELQGWSVDASEPLHLRHALEMALNYRGDMTIVRRSNPAPIDGYVFDLKPAGATTEMIVRVIPKNSDERLAIAVSDIANVTFSGKDTASGKSFETWIRKYAEKKLAGENASIESESLEHD